MAATGLFGLPGENLASLIASSAKFQSFCGASGAASARESVYTELVSRSSETPGSRAIVTWMDGGMDASRDSASAGLGAFSKAVTMTVVFEREFATVKAAYQGVPTFRDLTGGIVKDMLDASGVGSAIYIQRFNFKGFFLDDKSQPSAVSAVFSFTWSS